MEADRNKLQISKRVCIPMRDIDFSAVRAQGAGGQHVNKVSTAVHLRFDIKASSLPLLYKDRLLKKNDRRITSDGIVIIKSQGSRSQKKNKDAALQRLRNLIRSVIISPKKRIATKPTRAAQFKRLEDKTKRGKTKKMRRKVRDTE